MVRIDKTLSELWDLNNNPSNFTLEQLKEVATMAINALHKQEIEHEKFVDPSFKAIKKEEEKVKRYEKALKEIVENNEDTSCNKVALKYEVIAQKALDGFS
jgi:hypothetical protein